MPSSRPSGGRAPLAGSAKKSGPKEQLPSLMSPGNFKNNSSVVYHLRVYATIVFGAAAGVLGIEGWPGLAVYFASQLLCAVLLVLLASGNIRRYFPGWSPVVLEHVFSQITILSYILFWMVFYNICHVF